MPLRKRAFTGALNRGTVRDRIAERHAQLDHVRAGFRGSKDDFFGRCERWIAGRDVGDQAQFARFGEFAKAPRDAASSALELPARQLCGSGRLRHSAKGFPCLYHRGRKDSESRVRFSSFRGARRISSASACADSSAGMMPSSRASVRAASMASSSLTARVFGAALLRKPGVLGTHAGIIQTGGNGMRGGDLAVGCLQNVGVGSLQHSRPRSVESTGRRQPRRVFAERLSAPARFDADHFHGIIGNERVKQANGIRTAAHARDQR